MVLIKKILLSYFVFLSMFGTGISFAQKNEIREVVAEGVGRDVAEASQNAAQNALTNVVGSFIDSSTALEKRTQIQDGVKIQTKNITKDIKEYSQGVIQRFEIVDVKQSGLVTVTAKVSIRVDDFKVYIKKLAETEVKVNEGLFAQLKTEDKQNKNSSSLLYQNILLPLVQGNAITFSASAPKPLSQMNLSSIDLTSFRNKNSNKMLVAFQVEAKVTEGYWDNSKKILDSISKNRSNIGLANEEDWDRSFSGFRGSSDFNSQMDVFFSLAETEPGNRNPRQKSLTAYIINSAKINFSKSSAWAEYLVTGSGSGNWNGSHHTYRRGYTTPISTLQVELLGDGNNILQRERIDSKDFRNSKSGQMLILANQSDYFSSPWSLVGGYYNGGWSSVVVRDSNKFIILLAVEESAIRGAKSFLVKLIN